MISSEVPEKMKGIFEAYEKVEYKRFEQEARENSRKT